jgi:general secretion pathway protein D
MKNIIVILTCLLIPISNIWAEEMKAPPANIESVQKAQTPPRSVPRKQPSGGNLPVPVQGGTSAQSPLSADPPGLPSSAGPDQIKAFFSKPEEENYIILNFDNADLKDVINTIGSITNENFIISPGVDARITIHSAKKIPVSEVFNVFESVLEVNGMALVKSGFFYKIVQGTTAKQKPIEVRKGSEASTVPYVDRPVTQLVPVKYVPVTEVSTVLTPMLSQFGSIIPNARNSLLIINDLSSNLIRLLKVLKEIDVNAFKNTRMAFFKPRYSDVTSLSNELTEVLNALNLTREGIALIPIERINSLVVFSASTTLLRTVEGWLKKLDEEVITGQNVYVYPVQNVKAESIADILKALYETGDGIVSRKVTQKTQPKKGRTTPKRTPTRAKQKAAEGVSRVEIITFEPSNSLVILAPPGIYREMIEMIKKIDVYPREVLIEAVIAKVELTSSDKMGIQWSVLHNLEIDSRDYWGRGEGSSGSADIPSLPAQAAAVTGALPNLAAGPAGGFSYFLFRPERLAVLVHALASRGKVNILSSPRLLVRDQEEANIEVGRDVPTATSTTSTTTVDTLTQNIEYRTVGIKLKIKPTINDEKTVVLDLEQEVSSLGANQQVGQTGNEFPSFDTTKTKTSIVVPDKQGIIIGGIMEETVKENHQGIPGLRAIPILGKLFRWDFDSVEKTELVILITPHVITNKTEGSRLTNEFLDKLSEVKIFLGEKEAGVK